MKAFADMNMASKIAPLLLVSACVAADEYRPMSGGMGCWQNDSGALYGCSGGDLTDETGFSDLSTGQRYERISPDQAVDTWGGGVIDTPGWGGEDW
jgi:hypothetical protein